MEGWHVVVATCIYVQGVYADQLAYISLCTCTIIHRLDQYVYIHVHVHVCLHVCLRNVHVQRKCYLKQTFAPANISYNVHAL